MREDRCKVSFISVCHKKAELVWMIEPFQAELIPFSCA